MDELKMFVEMDSQGRIVIPKQIREYLGLKENMKLLITANKQKITLKPIKE